MRDSGSKVGLRDELERQTERESEVAGKVMCGRVSISDRLVSERGLMAREVDGALKLGSFRCGS